MGGNEWSVQKRESLSVLNGERARSEMVAQSLAKRIHVEVGFKQNQLIGRCGVREPLTRERVEAPHRLLHPSQTELAVGAKEQVVPMAGIRLDLKGPHEPAATGSQLIAKEVM